MLNRLGVEVDPFEEGDRKWVISSLTELREEEAGEEAAAPMESLNGAQVTALKDIVIAVATGEIPKSSAEEIIVASFPLDRARAKALLSDVVAGSMAPAEAVARAAEIVDAFRAENDGDPEPEQVRSPPCRQSGESRRDCLDRKISEIADENPEWQNDQVVAVAIDMCEKSCRCGEADERREFSPAIEALLEPFQKRVARWFERYETAQLAHLRKVANGGRATVAEHLRDVVDEVFDPEGISDEAFDALLLENSVWAAALEREVRTALREVWAQAIAEAHGEVGGSLLTMSDASVIEALTSQKTRLVEGVTSRLSNRVKNVLTKGLSGADAAKSLRELVKDELPALTDELRQVFGTKEARAATIVQTETGIASNTARFRQYQRSGVTKIRWSSAKDEAVRPSHMALDGDTIELGSTFSNGLRFPQDPQAANAAEVVNCRCRFFAAEYAKPE